MCPALAGGFLTAAPPGKVPLSFSYPENFDSFSFLLIFIGVQLLYNIVLVSTVQQSESAIGIHISPLLDFLPI